MWEGYELARVLRILRPIETGFQETTHTWQSSKSCAILPAFPRWCWMLGCTGWRKDIYVHRMYLPHPCPSSHKVWLECILHNAHPLQGHSTAPAHAHSPVFSTANHTKAHRAPDTTASLRTYLIFSEIDCENSKWWSDMIILTFCS